jgi:hypothetical protein
MMNSPNDWVTWKYSSKGSAFGFSVWLRITIIPVRFICQTGIASRRATKKTMMKQEKVSARANTSLPEGVRFPSMACFIRLSIFALK